MNLELEPPANIIKPTYNNSLCTFLAAQKFFPFLLHHVITPLRPVDFAEFLERHVRFKTFGVHEFLADDVLVELDKEGNTRSMVS